MLVFAQTVKDAVRGLQRRCHDEAGEAGQAKAQTDRPTDENPDMDRC